MTDQTFLNEFDEWASLADSDPEAFEKLRRSLIDQCIEAAPEDRRQRLRSLQWRIDQERARAKSPLGACIRLTRMMWDSVLGRGGLLENLQQLSATLEQRPVASRQTQVLPFPTRSK